MNHPSAFLVVLLSPKFEAYLAAAEDLDVAVGIHIGTGPPGAPALPGMGKYRAQTPGGFKPVRGGTDFSGLPPVGGNRGE